MRLSSQRGVAMIVALFALVLVAGIGTLLFSRTINEMRHSRDDAAIVQTLLLARGGSNVAGALLANDVNTMLRDAVRYTSTPGPWVFGEGSGDTPTASSVITRLTAVTNRLQPAVDGLICDNPIMPTDTGAEIQLRLYFSSAACGQALPSDVRLPAPRYVSGPRRNADGAGVQTYALPFVLVSEASLGEYRRNIVTQGEYRFEVGQANFSMWAYFTNREVSVGANNQTIDKIYFTDQTMIDGPVHTNGHFALAYDPWFGGSVSSAGCNNASCSTIDRGAYLYDYQHTEQYDCGWAGTGRYDYIQDASGGYVYKKKNGHYGYYAKSWSDSGPFYRREEITEWKCKTRKLDLIPDTVLGSSPNFGGNEPKFAGGVGWDSPRIDLPKNNYLQRDIAQGVGRADEGLYFNSALESLEFFAGTSAAWNGNVSSVTPTRVNGVWTPAATYQYVRGCTSNNSNSCTVYRFNAAGTVEVYNNNTKTWSVRSSGRTFNGVVYVNGAVQQFQGPARTTAGNPDTSAPAVAAFAQITLASDSNIRITGDIKYESPPCTSIPTRNADRSVNSANCNNLGAQNVLGVYTQSGNILVGHGHTNSGSDTKAYNAPDDVQVHAVLMSAQNEVKVEKYDQTDAGGFYLMGGMIQERRGIFGTFSGRGANATRTGYDRIYTYDPRMGRGMAPPFFPSTNVDDVTTVTFFTFGQREQLYD